MKLSFSTKGWHGYSWNDFCAAAKSMHFSGIELHNIGGAFFGDRSSPFHAHAAAATVRPV